MKHDYHMLVLTNKANGERLAIRMTAIVMFADYGKNEEGEEGGCAVILNAGSETVKFDVIQTAKEILDELRRHFNGEQEEWKN